MHEGDISRDARTWGMICHLSLFAGYVVPCAGLLAPLVIWMMKKEESAYIDYHGREALNFIISIFCVGLVNGLLCLTGVWLILGIPIAIALAIVGVVMPIIAAIKANDGEHYRYPYIFRLL